MEEGLMSEEKVTSNPILERRNSAMPHESNRVVTVCNFRQSSRLGAEELVVARLRCFRWVRLKAASGPCDLMFRLPPRPSAALPASHG
jgi:hypothetical protein